ncbi:hypothetical protein BRAS3809_5540009 [Bradyrhizobium sp. STM 3809]|nr:hypothetical protein BRAS3809_5540009 [Bradyrhizobium sp. STM 3809]
MRSVQLSPALTWSANMVRGPAIAQHWLALSIGGMSRRVSIALPVQKLDEAEDTEPSRHDAAKTPLASG